MAKPMTFKAYLKGVYSIGGDDNLFFFTDSPIGSIEEIRNKTFSPTPSMGNTKSYVENDRFVMTVGKSGLNPRFNGMSYPNFIAFVHPLSDENAPVEKDGDILKKEYVEKRDRRLHEYVRDFMHRVVTADLNCVYVGVRGSFGEPSEKDVIAYNMKK